jgi:hypothetical protein
VSGRRKSVIARSASDEAIQFLGARNPTNNRDQIKQKIGAPVLDPEKWKPVFGKDHAPTRNPDLDPIRSDQGLEHVPESGNRFSEKDMRQQRDLEHFLIPLIREML